MRVDQNRFLMCSSKGMSLWDLEKEERTFLKIEVGEPNLVELVDGKHVVVASDKWIRAFDF